jgi:hypothetical protein
MGSEIWRSPVTQLLRLHLRQALPRHHSSYDVPDHLAQMSSQRRPRRQDSRGLRLRPCELSYYVRSSCIFVRILACGVRIVVRGRSTLRTCELRERDVGDSLGLQNLSHRRSIQSIRKDGYVYLRASCKEFSIY